LIDKKPLQHKPKHLFRHLFAVTMTSPAVLDAVDVFFSFFGNKFAQASGPFLHMSISCARPSSSSDCCGSARPLVALEWQIARKRRLLIGGWSNIRIYDTFGRYSQLVIGQNNPRAKNPHHTKKK
jgi:hypothetical protein